MTAHTTRRAAQSPNTAPETPASLAYKHSRVLHHALHIGHPMMRAGKLCFIHSIIEQRAGGGIETTVYLAGESKAVPAAEVQLQVQPT